MIIVPEAPDLPLHTLPPIEQEKCISAMNPLVHEARESFSTVHSQFVDFLPQDEQFYVLVLLQDDDGLREFAYLSVWVLQNEQITGRLAKTPQFVQGFKAWDWYSIAESELFDWVIVNPDGTEEGHYVHGCGELQRRPTVQD